MKIIPLILTALAGISATPALAARESPDEKLARVLTGRVAGDPVACISLAAVRSSQIIDGQAIVYRVGANTFYLNRPTIGADQLDDDDILITRTPSTMLCRLDTVNLVARPSGIPRGFVGLGEFIPYKRVARR